MFLSKKKDIVEKLETRKAHTLDQDSAFATPVTKENSEVVKREKTKEELFELRKAMMKKRVHKNEENFTAAATQANKKEVFKIG